MNRSGKTILLGKKVLMKRIWPLIYILTLCSCWRDVFEGDKATYRRRLVLIESFLFSEEALV